MSWWLGLRPRPHWGSLQRSRRPPSWWGGGLRTPPPLSALRASILAPTALDLGACGASILTPPVNISQFSHCRSSRSKVKVKHNKNILTELSDNDLCWRSCALPSALLVLYAFDSYFVIRPVHNLAESLRGGYGHLPSSIFLRDISAGTIFLLT